MSLAAGIWFAIALLALLAELHSNTVYLFALTAGAAVAGVFASTGAGQEAQVLAAIATLAAGLPAAAWYRRRQRPAAGLSPADIGLEVRVLAIRGEGLRVSYRGTEWDAVLPGPPPEPGERLRIAGVSGNTLELSRKSI